MPTVGSEWTGLLTDLPAANPDVASTVRLTDGLVGSQDPSGSFNFRCVAQGGL